MENASKALLIAGAILLCILIIAIGMYIYNSAQGTIVSSLNSLSTQEVEAFNNQFESYQGVQKGTNVKNLMGKLIANANTYADEPVKIPVIKYTKKIKNKANTFQATYKIYTVESPQDYIDYCGKIKQKLELNHQYSVMMSYQKNGLIDCIGIRDDGILEVPKYPGKRVIK